jgi:lipoprotein-anchoring transpeptidase ErfK/SrfK
MLHSNYFIRGYAIHGYPSVPNYPASHGCIRIPNPNAAAVNGWIRLGDPIYVYR